MEKEEIKLTPSILKILGENTKIKILKELSSGPKMPTDISRRLDKSVPTIIEHLEKLTSAGLVKKQEQKGKKYVFYSLTQTGMELITNKSKLSIVLYSSIFLFIIGISLFGIESYNNITLSAAALKSGSAAYPSSALTNAYVSSSSNIVSVVIIASAFILLLIYVIKLRQINVKISVIK